MNIPLFNVNDLALLFLIVQSSMLACILLLAREKAGEGKGILAALLIVFALHALDVLVYWSEPIKALAAGLGVWPFWVLKWAPLAKGPLLFAYVRLKLTGQGLLLADAKHAFPVLIYPLVVWGVVVQLGSQGMAKGVFDYAYLSQSSVFSYLLWAQKVSVVVYGGFSIGFMWRNYKRLEQSFSNPASAQPLWLPIVVVGFMGLGLWSLAEGFVVSLGWYDVSHIFGVTANYLSFAFVTALVFYSLLKSAVVTPLDDVAAPIKPASEVGTIEPDTLSLQDLEAANALKQLLEDQALYLNPELTLEDFARAARLPERQVSLLLNSGLGQSFFECVNAARVVRAKALLTSETWPIQRVFEESGFNSKATFNRIFKRYTGTTPSAYRKQAGTL